MNQSVYVVIDNGLLRKKQLQRFGGGIDVALQILGVKREPIHSGASQTLSARHPRWGRNSYSRLIHCFHSGRYNQLEK